MSFSLGTFFLGRTIQRGLSLAMLALGLAAGQSARGAEWQWSTPVGQAPAYLWIPPDCQRVRGVVLASHNMIEQGILEHPILRKTLSELGFAEVWVVPSLDLKFDFNAGAGEKFQNMMNALADASGYSELGVAPIVPLGHSAHATFPWNFAAWNPQRTLCVLSVKGDAPQTTLTGYGGKNIDWGDRNIDGVPGLMVMSEMEWWDDRLTPALAYRDKHPQSPIASFAYVGRGHFDFDDKLLSFLAMFIRKAAEQRLPAKYPAELGAPVPLKPIDPAKGWLVDRWHKDQAPAAPSAPADQYTGDKTQAFWCFDKEMADETEAAYARSRGKKYQLVGFKQNDQMLSGEPCSPAVVTGDDGVTFQLQAGFLDTVAGNGGNPEKWAGGQTKGTAIGHATGGGNVTIHKIVGPVQQSADGSFAIALDRSVYTPDRRNNDAWVFAAHPGDEQYKSAVQQAQLKVPNNSAGAAQQISFPPIADQPRGTDQIALAAKSSSNMPVRYYVMEGPAEIDGNTLKFTPIPPRAKFPIKVTVVAWQWGRAIEPKVQTAKPVEISFSIVEQNMSRHVRQTINFNRDWRFQLGETAGAEQPKLDDSKWQCVGLPHSFSMPYFAANDRFYVGNGWYRKSFEFPAEASGKRIAIDFEGVFQVADVFLNGQLIGTHRGGYTGFEIDLTKAVRPGQNQLAIRVNNRWDATLAPRAGEHTFSGGIYRNVHLVISDPVHVAWYGTFVTTPKVSQESGIVHVQTEVANQLASDAPVTVRTSIVDAAGAVVGTMESSQTVLAGKVGVFEQDSPAIDHPRLWEPDHPNLYTVQTQVLRGGKVVDDYESPLGFRTIEFTADRGFFLNGKHYYFKGANVHQDHAGWGDAVTEAGMQRDVRMMKEAGFDFIRGSHYPHSPAFSHACDQQGMLFWSESAFWGTGGFGGDGFWACSAYPVSESDQKPFEESAKQCLRDMIRIHRNHPSIIVWSMSNEPFFSDGKVMPKVRGLLKDMVALSRQLDPTRPAAVGGVQRGEIDKIGDIAGYNGDGARMTEYLNPGVPSVVSEYGSTIADRPGAYEPGFGDLPRGAGQDHSEPYPWRYAWRAGEAIWCGFDHGSIAGRKFGAMGLVDYFRLPKRSWYWYRNAYRNIPPPEWPTRGTPAGLVLSSDTPSLRYTDGTDDAQIVVTVVDQQGKPLSNNVPVTLAIVSGPGEFPTGRTIEFAPDSDIAIRDGQAAIEFRSYHAGETVIRATSPGLKEGTLRIVSASGPAFVDGQSTLSSPRPYVRFEGKKNGQGSTQLTAYAKENPTLASSEAPGHTSRFANDGTPSTFWAATDNSPGQWWQVDLERFIDIEETRLEFEGDGAYAYRIEVSENGKDWRTLIDQTKTNSKSAQRSDTAPAPAVARWVRVVFTGLPHDKPATLREVSILGVLKG